MQASLRRQVTTVEGRFHQPAAIRKNVANSREPSTRFLCDVTLERLGGEKAIGQRQGPSHNPGRNWIVVKRKPDQADWHRGGEQLLGSLPERIDVERSMQPEQRSFKDRIDHRFAPHSNHWRLPYLPRIFAQSPLDLQ